MSNDLKQLDDLFAEIAAKHHLALSPDDPIMVVHTLVEHVARNQSVAQAEQLRLFKEEVEQCCSNWKLDAKDKAEKIVNAALAASKNASSKMLEQGTQMTLVTLRKELLSFEKKLSGQLDRVKHYSYFNALVCTITLVTAIAFLWSKL